MRRLVLDKLFDFAKLRELRNLVLTMHIIFLRAVTFLIQGSAGTHL